MPFHDPIPERKNGDGAGGGLRSYVQAERLIQIAFVLPSALAIGWFGGAYADEKLHTSWLTIAGVIFGCVVGMVYAIRIALDAEKSAKKRKQE